MSTRSAGRRRGAAVAAVLVLAGLGCSGKGPGAEACRTLERARCDRQAECGDWSDDAREDCRVTRDAECHAGAAPVVRDAADADVDACAEAIRVADCTALDDPFALPGCEPFAEGQPDAG